jgi:apolipoprotein D and lipocalin family protein
VHNSSRRADGRKAEVKGIARVVDDSNAKLKVTFAPEPCRVLPFVWGNYWILDIDADYTWALVGEPTHKFLWILSRTPRLSETVFDEVCASAINKGYEVTKLIRPQQT